jgi:hypothetical protein
VRFLARSLVVFMAVRMLAPPGVCLCEISLPFFGDLSRLLEPDGAPSDCPLDDHTHGCTTCQLPQGVQPRTAAAARPAPAFEPAPAPAAARPAVDRSPAAASSPPAPLPRAIYLQICALLI